MPWRHMYYYPFPKIESPLRNCRALTLLTILILVFGRCLPGRAARQTEILLPAETWRSPAWAGNARLEAVGTRGLRLTLPSGRPWAAAVQTASVDVGALPVLAVTVLALSPGASWVLKVDNTVYNPDRPHDIAADPPGSAISGRYLMDLREVCGGAWQGRQDVEVRLFVVGPPGATATFDSVSLLPTTVTPPENQLSHQLTAGLWTLRYAAESRRLLLRRPGAPGALSISLSGVMEAARAPSITREAGGAANGQETLVLRAVTDDAEYEARITAYPVQPGGTALFRWTVDAHWLKPHLIPAFNNVPECRYESSGGGEGNAVLHVLSGHRFGQAGLETGQAFLPSDAALGGTGLYIQNLTGLAPLFDAGHTSAARTVSASPEGFGFRMPLPEGAGKTSPLPVGTRLRLTDSFFAVSTQDASAPLDAARLYLELLATVYDALPDRPSTVYTDWQNMAERTLTDLLSPSCWSNPERGYLRNYVNEAWPPQLGELTVQVDPLVAALAYERTWERLRSEAVKRILPSLPDFYLPAIHCIRDYTNETSPTKSDSWYRVYPLIQLARAAELGVPEAKTLVRDSLETTIALAHKCRYNFPVFFNPQTLGDFTGAEPDCGGAYAYLMLQANDLFGDARYVEEAKQALAHIAQHGMNFAYELHLTALSAAACARLWKLTGDSTYLTLSLLPVANVLRHCRLYEPGYGLYKTDRLFFALNAMSGAYTAPFEQYQSWLALREYEEIAHDALPSSVRLLVNEFVKYGQTNLRFMYPAYMTPGSVVAVNERGQKNELALLIPVEDVNDGLTQSGKIGQELYGSGGPMMIAARTYTRLPEAGVSIYSEYPVVGRVWNQSKHTLQISVGGVTKHTTLVAVRYDAAKTGWQTKTAGLQVQVIRGSGTITDRHDEPGVIRFRVDGETTLLLGASAK